MKQTNICRLSGDIMIEVTNKPELNKKNYNDYLQTEQEPK